MCYTYGAGELHPQYLQVRDYVHSKGYGCSCLILRFYSKNYTTSHFHQTAEVNENMRIVLGSLPPLPEQSRDEIIVSGRTPYQSRPA